MQVSLIGLSESNFASKNHASCYTLMKMPGFVLNVQSYMDQLQAACATRIDAVPPAPLSTSDTRKFIISFFVTTHPAHAFLDNSPNQHVDPFKAASKSFVEHFDAITNVLSQPGATFEANVTLEMCNEFISRTSEYIRVYSLWEAIDIIHVVNHATAHQESLARDYFQAGDDIPIRVGIEALGRACDLFFLRHSRPPRWDMLMAAGEAPTAGPQ